MRKHRLSEAERRLLELIERGVVAHGGDLGGRTRRIDEALQLFDGRVTLRAEVEDTGSSGVKTVHAHVLTTLHEYEDEVLDACLFGIRDNPDAALEEISLIWITSVAGPIKSFLEQHGVQFSSTIIRAHRDGRVETDVPLMSIPSYTRARALVAELQETMKPDDFRSLCLYNAEANAILKSMEALGDKLDLTRVKMYPCVVPDRGVSEKTMDAALAKLNELVERNRPPVEQDHSPGKKPWWKFW